MRPSLPGAPPAPGPGRAAKVKANSKTHSGRADSIANSVAALMRGYPLTAPKVSPRAR
jgi:hypothetical protein